MVKTSNIVFFFSLKTPPRSLAFHSGHFDIYVSGVGGTLVIVSVRGGLLVIKQPVPFPFSFSFSFSFSSVVSTFVPPSSVSVIPLPPPLSPSPPPSPPPSPQSS